MLGLGRRGSEEVDEEFYFSVNVKAPLFMAKMALLPLSSRTSPPEVPFLFVCFIYLERRNNNSRRLYNFFLFKHDINICPW